MFCCLTASLAVFLQKQFFLGSIALGLHFGVVRVFDRGVVEVFANRALQLNKDAFRLGHRLVLSIRYKV